MFKRILRNRLFAGGVCLFVAGMIAFVILPGIYSNREATTKIWSAARVIVKGEKIEDAMLTEKEVGVLGLPQNLVKTKDEIVGKFAHADIYPGDFLMEEKFETYRIDPILDHLINEDKRLVTVTLPTLAAGLAAHIEKGDIVMVANYIPERDVQTAAGMIKEASQVIIYPELTEMTIYDIENKKVNSVPEERENTGADNADADPIPNTVTLIATQDQAMRLIEAEYAGQIHLIFVRR
jgi:pilus assembly protein CpaB